MWYLIQNFIALNLHVSDLLLAYKHWISMIKYKSIWLHSTQHENRQTNIYRGAHIFFVDETEVEKDAYNSQVTHKSAISVCYKGCMREWVRERESLTNVRAHYTHLLFNMLSFEMNCVFDQEEKEGRKTAKNKIN